MMNTEQNMQLEFVRASVSEAALYEQLAEEASELTHAALKVARILRNEIPTPVTLKEAMDNIIEETADVSLCLKVLRFTPWHSLTELDKLKRWVERLEKEDSNDEKRNV